jgi:phosphoglycerol transferase MdoB-like AlkP superfamily enzyme
MKLDRSLPHVAKSCRCQAVFFLGVYSAYLIYLFGIHGSGNDVKGSLAPLLLQIGLPAVELAFYAALCYLLLTAWHIRNLVLYKSLYLTIPLAVAVIYTVQVYSLHISGNFISILAIENSAENRLIDKSALYPSLAAVLAWWLLYVACCHYGLKSIKQTSPTHKKALLKPAVVTIALMVAQVFLVSVQGDQGAIGVDYLQTPISSLSHNYLEYTNSKRMYAAESANAAPAGRKFPLEKYYIYKSALPFERTKDYPQVNNIIVLFTEGTSAALLGCYGGTHPGLTPNIDALAAKSMRVTNYYNHTAATYRGLQGQMVSGYPRVGGSGSSSAWENEDNKNSLSKIHYKSLPMVLRDMNYKTYFMSPHHDTVALNTLLRSLGFNKVYTFESISKELQPVPDHLTAGSLSDKGLFSALEHLLSDDTFLKSKQPFFVGTYNIGTHAFLDVGKDDVKYGDGSNPVLNRFHNYDLQLGKFLKYFFASPYAKNTILIFTTDHATYPDPYLRKAVNQYYRPYFVGRIPLLIYDPGHALPKTFDAAGRTSVDFTPTLLQILGIKKDKNSFVGSSLFEPRTVPFGVSALGHEFFATDSEAVYYQNQIPAKYQDEFLKQVEQVKKYYLLESENRIFQPAP